MNGWHAVFVMLFISAGLPVATFARDPAPTLLVTTFGARCDGTTDDTPALRAAAAAVPPAGGVLQFPLATCVLHGTLYLRSHTTVRGGGVRLLAAQPWAVDHPSGYAMMENAHFSPGGPADTDITVSGVIFDYGAFGKVSVPGGGKHALRFDFAQHIHVSGNTFTLRGAEDAVAGLGVSDMVVEQNAAFDFINCAYDFWYGSKNVKVVNNYAETEHSSQVVNFNPDPSHDPGPGMVAEGFLMQDNTLIVTGPKAAPVQIEPLGPGSAVRDVTVTGNKLHNVYLVLRGDVQGAVIRNNVLSTIRGGPSAFETYPWQGQIAHRLSFTANTVVGAETQPSEVAVVRMDSAESEISGNTFVGGQSRVQPFYGRPNEVALRQNLIVR